SSDSPPPRNHHTTPHPPPNTIHKKIAKSLGDEHRATCNCCNNAEYNSAVVAP
ncbi:Hypothetical predicted protein, partial [Olea europaea subsp. europaea]